MVKRYGATALLHECRRGHEKLMRRIVLTILVNECLDGRRISRRPLTLSAVIAASQKS